MALTPQELHLDKDLLEKFKFFIDLMQQVKHEANGTEVTLDHVSRVLDRKPSVVDTVGLKNTLSNDEAEQKKTAKQIFEVRDALGSFLSMLAPLNRNNFKLEAGAPDLAQRAHKGSQFKEQEKLSRLADEAPANSLFHLMQDIQNQYEDGLKSDKSENKDKLQNKLLNTFKMTMSNAPKLRAQFEAKYQQEYKPKVKPTPY
jgi:hypothetical protein